MGITFDIVFILHDVKNLVRQPDGQQFLLVHAKDFRSKLTSIKTLSDFQLSTKKSTRIYFFLKKNQEKVSFCAKTLKK